MSESTIFAAFLAAQKEIKWAEKTAQNPHLKNRYADLESVISAVKPHINKHGLALMQMPKECNGEQLTLKTIVASETGETIEFTSSIPLQKKDPQGYGAALTYLRRYAISSVFGLYQSDDDAESAVTSENWLEAIRGAADMDTLVSVWKSVPKSEQPKLIAAKDARKTELSKSPMETF